MEYVGGIQGYFDECRESALTGLVTTETNIEVGDDSQVVTSHQSETGQSAGLLENVQH